MSLFIYTFWPSSLSFPLLQQLDHKPHDATLIGGFGAPSLTQGYGTNCTHVTWVGTSLVIRGKAGQGGMATINHWFGGNSFAIQQKKKILMYAKLMDQKKMHQNAYVVKKPP